MHLDVIIAIFIAIIFGIAFVVFVFVFFAVAFFFSILIFIFIIILVIGTAIVIAMNIITSAIVIATVVLIITTIILIRILVIDTAIAIVKDIVIIIFTIILVIAAAIVIGMGHCCFYLGVWQEKSLSLLHWRTRRGFTHFEIRSPLRSSSIFSLLGSALQSPSTSYFWLICAAQSLRRVLYSSTLSVQGSFGLVFVSRSLSLKPRSRAYLVLVDMDLRICAPS